MKIIDAHIHILDRELIPSGVRFAWARQALGRREPMRNLDEVEPNVMVKQSDPSGSLTIAAFDRLGIDGGLIPVVDWTLAAGRSSTDVTIDELHDFHDRLFKSSKGRIRYCAGIDPRHHDAKSRLTEVVGRTGCSGIKIYPAAGWRLTDQSSCDSHVFFRWRPINYPLFKAFRNCAGNGFLSDSLMGVCPRRI